MTLPLPILHLVTSRRRTAPDARTVREELRALEALIDEAVDAGVDVVQVRERDVDSARLFELVGRLVKRAEGTASRILVNERADVAAAAGAAGVHLPSAGVSAERVRTIGPGWLIGRSMHQGDEPADRAAVDYLLFGTVFPSESKPGAAAAGIDALRRVVRASGRPVVAIGGITPDAARACLEAGAVGIAAIGAFLPVGLATGAMGPRAAVAAFRAALAPRA